jgi:pimeloyl-ACP methyl ester carboxylesterase
MLGLAERLRDRGYEAVLWELRGHGSRPGPYTFGAREADDVRAVLDWGRGQDRPLPLPVVMIGFSAGAAVACQAASGLSEIRALVADSISPRLRLAIRRGLQLRHPHLPGWLAWPTWWAVQLAVGARLGARDPWALAPRLRQPILVIAGGQDHRVDPAMVRAFVARWAGPTEVWFDPAAGHVSGYPNDPDAYVARVAAFLAKTVG